MIKKVFRVAVPLQVWHAELTLELDNDLPLLEETVLRLIGAGVKDVERIAALLALEADQALDEVLIYLLKREAISGNDTAFEITPMGKGILERAATRELQQRDVEIMRDPYTRELLWEPNEPMIRREQDFKNTDTRVLPLPQQIDSWSESQIRHQHDEIQALIDLNGLAEEDVDQARHMRDRNRQLVGVKPLHRRTAYRLATLHARYLVEKEQITWRLQRGEGTHGSDRALKALEEQGLIDVLPLNSFRTEPVDAICQVIESMLDLHARNFEEIDEEERGLQPVQAVITAARQHLVLFSSFCLDGKPDLTLLETLKTAMKDQPGLNVDLVQTRSGIVPKGVSKQQLDDLEQTVISLLQALRQPLKSRLRLRPPLGRSDMTMAFSEKTFALTRQVLLIDEARNGLGLFHERHFEVRRPEHLLRLRRDLGTALKDAMRPPSEEPGESEESSRRDDV